MDLSAYRFSKSHEWVRQDDGAAHVGITDYAQSQLGDVIYVELPKPGEEIVAGGKLGVIESVKAASDLYSPLSGRVVEVNPALAAKPEVINTDPYGEGWMLKVEPTGDTAGLLDEAAYTEFTKGL
ncbi:MAG TPA: glycine cleavage system protein GcvH [Candidatus Dormibacteraeota bacterium]|nr:glycine cleavage system protein GcvH [Candidatus Dormibacteraeota bacterium]